MPEETTVETPAQPAAASASSRETIIAAMDRLGGFDGDPGTEAPAETAPEAPAEAPAETPAEAQGEPEKTEKKPKAKAKKADAAPAPGAPPGTDEDRAQLEALAKKLGLVVDARSVSATEQVEFRRAKADAQNRINAREREAMAAISAKEQEAASRIAKADQLIKLLDDGDLDGFAKATEKWENWDAVTSYQIERMKDPHYKRLADLERKEQEREASIRQQQEEATRHEQAQREQAARSRHLTRLSEGMGQSNTKLLKAMHDDPFFVHTVFQIQKENFDPETRSTVTAEQALRMNLKGSNETLEASMKRLYERLKPVFEATAEPGKKPAPKTSTASPPKPGAAVTKAPEGKSDYMKYFNARMAEAAAEDRARIAGRRAG